MTSPAPAALPSSSNASPYPFASAPDIIRAHQKDLYFTGHLSNTLNDLLRRLLGARTAHSYAPEARTAAALLYFALTTLPGNRTLGEEYCDLVQVDTSTPKSSSLAPGRLPSLSRRASYVAASIILPYLASRALPTLRQRLRKLLERRLETLRQREAANSFPPSKLSISAAPSRQLRMCEYLLRNLSSLTSSAPAQAVTLAIFYFTGTYYQLSKRLLSLRYVFTRTVADTPDRAGYELLGVLLVVQLAVQGYLHVRATLEDAGSQRQRQGFDAAPMQVSLDHEGSYSANNDLLMSGLDTQGSSQATKVDIAATTHTPVGAGPRFQLTDDKTMAFIKGQQQRKCTLCLEELKDPAATQCGHVFCWECIGDWVREKPECPLCRRDAMVQHILPLRVM